MYSLYSKTGRCSSEGIQIGNVRSIYGVLGAWTTVQHDRGDPVGTFLDLDEL